MVRGLGLSNVDISSHVSKKVKNRSINYFIVCLLDLKLFGGQTFENVPHVRKLVSGRDSVSLNVCLASMCFLSPKTLGVTL